MAQPDIIATNRTGSGYLSTTFSDPTDYAIIYRKWVFGDGVVIEGAGLQTINHTYYQPGEYDVTLVAQTFTDQYSVNKSKFVVVDVYYPVPGFIISQSMDADSGEYWRLYFDQSFHLVFEDNRNIIRSKDPAVEPGRWSFIDFNRNTCKMKVGTFSYYIKELEVVKLDNLNPLTISETKTDILPNSTMKIDELKIWAVNKDTTQYYKDNRGKAGYLDTL
jgi:PKD repeat protein